MQAIRRAEGRVKDELYPDMSDGSTLSTTQSRVPEPGLRRRLVLEEKPIAMEHCVRQVMATAATIDVSSPENGGRQPEHALKIGQHRT